MTKVINTKTSSFPGFLFFRKEDRNGEQIDSKLRRAVLSDSVIYRRLPITLTF